MLAEPSSFFHQPETEWKKGQVLTSKRNIANQWLVHGKKSSESDQCGFCQPQSPFRADPLTYEALMRPYFLKVTTSLDNTILGPKPLVLGGLLDVQHAHNNRQLLIKSGRWLSSRNGGKFRLSTIITAREGSLLDTRIRQWEFEEDQDT